ncbi:S-layer homology domain-containing protein [Paenibacillus sp. FA6]|uniref:S-layer homology domain-containing protein n=1 Tax=Paenibacillus sp. FA6 TaxID=3413029 RepID=UPI003F654DC6
MKTWSKRSLLVLLIFLLAFGQWGLLGTQNVAEAATIVYRDGATYFVDDDNWGGGDPNSAADNDMDSTIGNGDSKYMIDMKIPNVTTKPEKNAILLVRAFDVDVHELNTNGSDKSSTGEWDRVYMSSNAKDIELGPNYTPFSLSKSENYKKEVPSEFLVGALSGQNNYWNTTAFELDSSMIQQLFPSDDPKDLFLANTTHHYFTRSDFNEGWTVIIDWAQLVIDGGSREFAELSEAQLKVEKDRVSVDTSFIAKESGNYSMEVSVIERVVESGVMIERNKGTDYKLFSNVVAGDSKDWKINLGGSGSSIDPSKEYIVNMMLFKDRGVAGGSVQNGTSPGEVQHVISLSTHDLVAGDFSKSSQRDVTTSFEAEDFQDNFFEISGLTLNGQNLQRIVIETLPDTSKGHLELNGVPVSEGIEIAVADLDKLTFVPWNNKFQGTVTFTWNGYDNQGRIASEAGTVTIEVGSSPVVRDLTKVAELGQNAAFTADDFSDASHFHDLDGDDLVAVKFIVPSNLNTQGTMTFERNGSTMTMVPANEYELTPVELDTLIFTPASNLANHTTVTIPWYGYDGHYYSVLPADIILNYQSMPPIATLSSSAGGHVNAAFQITIAFDKGVTGFADEDLVVDNGTASDVTVVDATTYTAMITPTMSGQTVTITVAAGAVTDVAGNSNAMSNTIRFMYDADKPVVTFGGFTNQQQFIRPPAGVSVSVSEAVYWLDGALLTSVNALPLISMTQDGSVFTDYTVGYDEDDKTFTLLFNSALRVGVYEVNIAGNVARDDHQNMLDAASASFTVIETSDAPMNAKAVAGDGAATVSFDAPASNGGSVITQYTVTSSPGGLTETRSDAGSVTFKRLTNGTAYTFTVVATNAAGDSAPSLASASVTPMASSNNSNNNSSGNSSSSPNNSLSNSSSNIPVRSADGRLTLPVGSAGEVSLDGKIFMTIPAHANSQLLEITIKKVANTQELSGHNGVAASELYDIQKNFLGNLNKSATLTLVFDSTELNSGQTAAIFYYDEAMHEWVKMEGGIINGNRISVEVKDFNTYAVWVIDQVTGLPIEAPSAVGSTKVNFNDIVGHWAESMLKQAVQQGIVKGYTDGSLKPNGVVTRSEFVTMLMNALKPASEGVTLSFADSEQIPAWSKQAISQVVEAGIVTGYTDGNFRPYGNITRNEMAVMIARAYGTDMTTLASTGFSDDREIPDWARGAVFAMRELGIVKGRSNNNFVPGGMVTRAEAVTMVMNLLQGKNAE